MSSDSDVSTSETAPEGANELTETLRFLTVTKAAQEYLKELLAGQESPGIGVRIFVEKPGTPYAECCMAYCPAGEEQEDDIKLEFAYFPAYIDARRCYRLPERSSGWSVDL